MSLGILGVGVVGAACAAAAGGTYDMLRRRRRSAGMAAAPQPLDERLPANGDLSSERPRLALESLARALRANAKDPDGVCLDALRVAASADALAAAARALEVIGAEARGEEGAPRRADGATPTRALAASFGVNRAAQDALEALASAGGDPQWTLEFSEHCDALREWADDEARNAALDVVGTLRRQ